MEIRSAVITGGAGFVGGAICRALQERHKNCRITIIDLRKPIIGPVTDERLSYVEADITCPLNISDAIRSASPEVVFHSAGIVPPLSERYSRGMADLVSRINVEGTQNTIDAAEAAGCAALVYTSSCTAVIDDMSRDYANIDETWPVSLKSSIYGESKARAEQIVVKASGDAFKTCVLRPSVICGEGDGQLVPSIAACVAKRETPYIIGHGRNMWDVSYVGNVADAHVLAAENLLSNATAQGEVFFIQNNEPIAFRDFSLAVWKNLGHVPPFEVSIPLSLAWLFGLLAELYTWLSGTTSTLSRGSVKDASSTRYASGRKAERILGFKPRVGLEQGLRISCQDYAQRLQKLPRT